MKNIRINNPRKNYYTVVADTDEFGINEVVFEGISFDECIAYIKANTKAQKKPLWAVGVETERTHRRHYVVVRSRDASTAWNQVYRHGYNNGYLCVDRINISAESPAITTAAEQEQEAPAETETEQATEEATIATEAAEEHATTAHPVPAKLAREYDARTYTNRDKWQRCRLPEWGSLCNTICWQWYHSAAINAAQGAGTPRT